MATTRTSRVTALAVFVGVSIAVCSSDAGAAKAMPTLRFRPVLLDAFKVPPPAAVGTSDPTADAAVASCDPAAVAALKSVPTTTKASDTRDACVILPDGDRATTRYYLGPAGLTGTAVKSATAEFLSGQGWTVKMDLTHRGSAQWDQIAEQQFHEQVALVLDGQVVSAPTIQPDQAAFSTFDGTAVVSGGAGGFTQREAKKLAALIAIAR